MSIRSVLIISLCSIIGLFVSAVNAGNQEGRQITCSGRVIDESGKAVSGAVIALFEMEPDATEFKHILSTKKGITTEANGSFELNISANGKQEGLMAAVVAIKRGLAIGWANWNLKNNVDVTITLGKHAVLEGTVVDENDKYIAGAEVRAILITRDDKDDLGFLGGTVFAGLVTKTDEVGAFSFNSIPVNATAEFLIKAPGRAGHCTIFDAPTVQPKFKPGQKDIRIKLPAEAVIEGRVVDAKNGRGVSGVRLTVQGIMMLSSPDTTSYVSGIDGRFRISGLPAGGYILKVAEPTDVLREWWVGEMNVIVAAGEVKTGVELKVAKGGVLEVKVTEKTSSSAVKNASVIVMSLSERYKGLFSFTGNDGVARIRLKPGEYIVSSIAKHGYKEALATLVEGQKVTITEGGVKQLNIQLVRLSQITGVVRDRTGKPVSDTEILIFPCQASGRTDAQGKFELPCDYDPARDQLYIFARQVKKNLVVLKTLSWLEQDVELTLSPGVTVRGQVMDPNGTLLRDAVLSISVLLDGNSESLDLLYRTNSQGFYEIPVLAPAERYRISVGFENYRVKTTVVEVPKGASRQIEVDPIKLGGTEVSGKVVNDNGEGIQGALVEFYHIESKFSFPTDIKLAGTAISDADGSYLLEKSDPSPETKSTFAIAKKDGYALGWCEARSDNVEIKISDDPKILAGHVVNRKGTPIPDASVHAIVSNDSLSAYEPKFGVASTKWLTAQTDADGRFQFSDIPGGARAEFVVLAHGYSKTFTWETTEGLKELKFKAGQSDITIVTSKVGAITGRVIDKTTGNPVEAVKVFIVKKTQGAKGKATLSSIWSSKTGTFIYKTMEGDSRSILSDKNGEFVVQELSPGHYSVFPETYSDKERKWITEKQSIQIEPGQTGQITLYVMRPGTIDVLVTNESDGSPIGTAKVKLSSMTGKEEASVHTNAAGIASFSLAPGLYKLGSVIKTGYVMVEKDLSIQLAEGQTRKIEVHLRYKPGFGGICTDPDGQPVQSAVVYTLPPSENETTTGADGKYQIVPNIPKPLAGNRFLYVVAQQDERGLIGIKRMAPSVRTGTVVDLKLQPAGTIAGRVVDDRQQPISEALVTVYLDVGFLGSKQSEPVLYEFVTDSTGTFEFPGIAPDFNYLIVADANGYGKSQRIFSDLHSREKSGPTIRNRKLGQAVLFTEDGSFNLGDFVLKSSTLSISGVVVNVMGYPLSNVELSVSGEGQSDIEPFTTNADGIFRFDGLCDGLVHLLTKTGTRTRLKAGTTNYRFVISRRSNAAFRPVTKKQLEQLGNAAIEVIVIDAESGQPLIDKGISVDVSQASGNNFRIYPDKKGFVYFCVEAGKHLISAGKWSEYPDKKIRIDVENNKSYQFKFELTRKPQVKGTIFDEGGLPVGGAKLELLPYDFYRGKVFESAPDGTFKFMWDPSSRLGNKACLRIHDKNRSFGAIVEISSETYELNINLSPLATLDLYLTGPDGKPFGLYLEMYLQSQACKEVTFPQSQYIETFRKGNIAVAGHFRVSLIPPTPEYWYMFTAYHRSFTIKAGQFQAGESKTMNISIK